LNLVILGASGLLGTELTHYFSSRFTVKTFTRSDLDVTKPSELSKLSALPNLEWVINCTGYTQVDACETNPDIAFSLNANAPFHLAQFCSKNRLKLIHFSTDYVFDGEKPSPYLETDTCNPISVYGLSKYQGEQHVLTQCKEAYVFRIQWLYGHNKGFVPFVFSQAKTPEKTVKALSDQWGTHTSTQTIAQWVEAFLKNKPPFGLYHIRSSGYATWFELANFINQNWALGLVVTPSTMHELSRPAKRPANSRLDISKAVSLNIYTPKSWQDDLKEFMQ